MAISNLIAISGTVLEAPAISQEPSSKSVAVDEGTLVLLPCDATGVPQPSITWDHGGKALPGHDERVVQLSTGALKITNVSLSDAGLYHCRATNKVGEDEKIVELSVQSRQKEDGTNVYMLSTYSNNILSLVTDSCGLEHHAQSSCSSLSMDEFPDYVESLHANGNVRFFEQFKVETHCNLLCLHNVDCLLTCSAYKRFKLDCLVLLLCKTRPKTVTRILLPVSSVFVHLVCCFYMSYCVIDDHARVLLPDLPGMAKCDSDYISAAIIDVSSIALNL